MCQEGPTNLPIRSDSPQDGVVPHATVRFHLTIPQTVLKYKDMKIKFLRNCEAPQVFTRIFCECCGPERQPAELTFFAKDEEWDPEDIYAEIDLTNLKYGVDFSITEYP